MKGKPTSVVTKTALISVLSLFWVTGFSAQTVEERLQRLEQMAESRGELQADIMFQLNALQQELQQLRGQVEQHQFQLKQLQERQRDLYRDIERRLSQLQSGAQLSGSSANSDSGSSTSAQSNPGVNGGSTPVSAQRGGDIHSEYQNIFAMVRDKQYDQAVVAYQQFLKTYPNSQYEANVHYWLGQIYYIRQQLDLALAEYQLVTSRFPDSSRAADALFKQGKVLALQNKREEARAIFQQVIDKYDGTLEQLARTELQKLK